MADDKELRIVQIKAIQEGEKRKHSKMMENLRHKHVMEELKFMAENNITSFSARMPPFKRKKNRDW